MNVATRTESTASYGSALIQSGCVGELRRGGGNKGGKPEEKRKDMAEEEEKKAS